MQDLISIELKGEIIYNIEIKGKIQILLESTEKPRREIQQLNQNHIRQAL